MNVCSYAYYALLLPATQWREAHCLPLQEQSSEGWHQKGSVQFSRSQGDSKLIIYLTHINKKDYCLKGLEALFQIPLNAKIFLNFHLQFLCENLRNPCLRETMENFTETNTFSSQENKDIFHNFDQIKV